MVLTFQHVSESLRELILQHIVLGNTHRVWISNMLLGNTHAADLQTILWEPIAMWGEGWAPDQNWGSVMKEKESILRCQPRMSTENKKLKLYPTFPDF